MKRILSVLLILLVLFCGCQKSRPAGAESAESSPLFSIPSAALPSETEPVITAPPDAPAPDTISPATTPSESLPPETEPLTTVPPETAPPETTPTDTAPPATVPPETEPSDTAPPETDPPETAPPETGTLQGGEKAEPFVYQGLVDLAAADSRFVIDQRYATENNFTGRVHYDRVLVLVQEDVLPMLIKAADLAEARGCRIKIWDAYRPISVQQALHDSAPAELAAYVPAPGPYSMHARGITVDVTLCDMDGNELDMPTEFDDFSERAHSDYAGATDEQKANRALLNEIMSGAGFTRSRLEWWHFDGPNRDNYPILDLSFAEWEAARDAE